MTTRYNAPSIEAIQEDSEDESRDALRGSGKRPSSDLSSPLPRSSMDPTMAPTTANTGRERERERQRPRRKHRSKEGGSSKHQSRAQGKSTSMRKTSGPPARENGSDGQRMRHRRTYSNRSSSSTSSEEEEDEPIQDHREVLAAARTKLMSPSTISAFTSLTASTNKSSGSSGSNSTVTQASVTKRSSLGKRPAIAEAPMSPAVPDPPNVFAFLDNESLVDAPQEQDEGDEEAVEDHGEEEHDSEEDGEEDDEHHQSGWKVSKVYNTSDLPPHLSPDHASASASASSSTSSSFHGSDHFSEAAADNDTDRSTSPERSVKDHTSDQEPEPEPPTDRASVRMATQMAAAQRRQSLYGSMQNFGTPNMPRGNVPLPHIPSTLLSPRYPQLVQQRSLPPRAEKLPATGYELLATRLSSYNSLSELEDGTAIKPIYRKFGALNHRLLLHLQDELSELEEQLHRLDNADTQSRRAGLGGGVMPASRRASALQGGELQWHKTDILGKIGFKLAQYNQALSSFNTTQSLSPPHPADVDSYREYLSTEHPIAEQETHFLDPADDLVSICSSIPPSSPPASTSTSNQSLSPSPAQSLSRSDSQISSIMPSLSLSPSATPSTYDPKPRSQSQFQALALAIATAVLVPILTFSVIPNFIGRLTVVGLVAAGVVFALMQAGLLGKGCFGREGLVCGGIYGGVMVVVAGVMA